MAIRQSASNQRFQLGTSVSSQSLLEPSVVTTEPSFTKGQWITYPDGTKFRCATNYSRARATFQPEGGENTTGVHRNGPFHVTSSGGGLGYNDFIAGWWNNYFTSCQGSRLGSPPSFSTNERNQAVTKALNQLADQKANVAENLATLSQTVKMFKTPIRAFTGLVASAKSKKTFSQFWTRSYRQLLRDGIPETIAGNYLAFVYGFKPLMQDIFGISELAKEAGKKPLFLYGKGSGRSDAEYASKYRWYISSNPYTKDEYIDALRVKSVTRAVIWARISDSYPGIRTLNQLGLANPAALAWELVPFSFVMDWALPIGPVLQALTAPAGLTFVDGSVARRVESTCRWRISTSAPPGVSNYRPGPGTGSIRHDGYNRERLSNWPVPGLYYDSDPLRLGVDGSDRVFKALALAIVNSPRLR